MNIDRQNRLQLDECTYIDIQTNIDRKVYEFRYIGRFIKKDEKDRNIVKLIHKYRQIDL